MLKAEDLLGTWKLVLWRVDYSDGRESSFPFGDDGGGMIMYTADGHMSAVLHAANRGPVSTQYVVEAPAEEKARLFNTFMYYGGRYRIEAEAGDVVHIVEKALNPDLIGTEQVRHVKFEDGFLILSGEEKIPGKDLERRHVVRWRRA